MENMISVVIPVLNEEENVVPLFKEIKEALTYTSHDYEIIFVDDGSTDGTLEQLRTLLSKEEKSIALRLYKEAMNPSGALRLNYCSRILTIDWERDIQE